MFFTCQTHRKLVFEDTEKQYLRQLPITPFEPVEWDYNHKIYPDCHIIYEKNHYSCPYQYLGNTADLRISKSLVEIYCNDERIASHVRFPAYMSNRWSTHEEDLPENFSQAEWNKERYLNEAEAIGCATHEVVKRIFSSYTLEERGFNPSKSVLKLARSYNKQRCENACELALKSYHSPRYRHLKSIISSNEDIVYAENRDAGEKAKKSKTAGYVRGAEYYRRYDND